MLNAPMLEDKQEPRVVLFVLPAPYIVAHFLLDYAQANKNSEVHLVIDDLTKKISKLGELSEKIQSQKNIIIHSIASFEFVASISKLKESYQTVNRLSALLSEIDVIFVQSLEPFFSHLLFLKIMQKNEEIKKVGLQLSMPVAILRSRCFLSQNLKISALKSKVLTSLKVKHLKRSKIWD